MKIIGIEFRVGYNGRLYEVGLFPINLPVPACSHHANLEANLTVHTNVGDVNSNNIQLPLDQIDHNGETFVLTNSWQGNPSQAPKEYRDFNDANRLLSRLIHRL